MAMGGDRVIVEIDRGSCGCFPLQLWWQFC